MTTPFICVAVETTGLRSSAGIIEIGWAVVDVSKPTTEQLAIEPIKPPVGTQWETAAYQLHSELGIESEQRGIPLEQAWPACESALPAEFAVVLWSDRFMRDRLDRDIGWRKLLARAKGNVLDFQTVNRLLATFTDNPIGRCERSRALDKLILMNETIRKWNVLFRFATMTPPEVGKR
jgi:hypothetical protein